MSTPSVFLVDVYDTILTCDFRAHVTELPALAGIGAQRWNEAWVPLGPDLTEGRITVAEAYEQVVKTCGKEATPELVGALQRRDLELLRQWTHLYEDTATFFGRVREAGKRSCLVSNCSDTTRAQLVELGVDRMVDAMVLSCEAGVAKPAAQIYLLALEQLDAAAAEAVFVDDQVRYCEGAEALGIRSFQMLRGQPGPGQVPAAQASVATVHSFDDLSELI
ncbi:MAG TPA: HAD-IA family hydrolase [Acidimicrobiales bacterium]|nr:HAD-IA family hydrolase [Acidimicrobiales bacterium]